MVPFEKQKYYERGPTKASPENNIQFRLSLLIKGKLLPISKKDKADFSYFFSRNTFCTLIQHKSKKLTI